MPRAALGEEKGFLGLKSWALNHPFFTHQFFEEAPSTSSLGNVTTLYEGDQLLYAPLENTDCISLELQNFLFKQIHTLSLPFNMAHLCALFSENQLFQYWNAHTNVFFNLYQNNTNKFIPYIIHENYSPNICRYWIEKEYELVNIILDTLSEENFLTLLDEKNGHPLLTLIVDSQQTHLLTALSHKMQSCSPEELSPFFKEGQTFLRGLFASYSVQKANSTFLKSYTEILYFNPVTPLNISDTNSIHSPLCHIMRRAKGKTFTAEEVDEWIYFLLDRQLPLNFRVNYSFGNKSHAILLACKLLLSVFENLLKYGCPHDLDWPGEPETRISSIARNVDANYLDKLLQYLPHLAKEAVLYWEEFSSKLKGSKKRSRETIRILAHHLLPVAIELQAQDALNDLTEMISEEQATHPPHKRPRRTVTLFQESAAEDDATSMDTDQALHKTQPNFIP